MSLSSFISDLYNTLSVSDVQAEPPPTGEKQPQSQEESTGEEGEKEEAEVEPEEEEPQEAEAEAEAEVGEEEEEEEEEEGEEPVDHAPAIQEECTNSKECKPYKHHYDECVERVTAAASDKKATGPKEDCVEEFFHILHCASACAAPKIFAQLR